MTAAENTTEARGPMSQEHKEALAAGREQSRAVKRYLEALDAHKPRRGRKRTKESMQKQLEGIEAKLSGSDPLTRLNLLQERADLQAELNSEEIEVDISALEEDFVRVGRGYGERKGISYAVWREVGVDSAILKRAGITRGA
jgi:hypothetical protein